MKGKTIMTTMKKLIALTLTLIGMFQLTSCKNNDMHYEDEIYLKSNYQEADINSYYTYYNPAPIFDDVQEDSNVAVEQSPKGKELDEEQKHQVGEIFERLTEYYGIEKEMPEMRVISSEEMNGGTGTAVDITGRYDEQLNVIYITPKFKDATVAHEMMHYLSGDGLKYTSSGKRFGRAFSEGVTNYLSTKLYKFPAEGYSIYELETHQAEMLATVIGDEKLAEAYFTGDITSLREDFNSTLSDWYKNEILQEVELTPFDTYVGCIDAYFMFLSNIENDPENIINYISIEADTIESMMLAYGKKKGKENELKEVVHKLIENEQMISWSYYTSFSEMIS